VITAPQLRAARALLGIDQRHLAGLAGLSVPTIQRMEASDGVIRGNVDSLMKLISALELAGIELIQEGTVSQTGGRGVRLKESMKEIRLDPPKDVIEGAESSQAGRR
jgi:transcriptional regulator with XRE-family HTH domain